MDSAMFPIDRRIQSCQRLLVLAHKFPLLDKTAQTHQIKKLTLMFKALLTQKASQKAIDDIRKNHSCNTQNTSTGQTDNARPRVSIRDILKEKIAGRR
jgi:hypothetical protein